MTAQIIQIIPVQPRLIAFRAGLDPEQIGLAADFHIPGFSGGNVELTEKLLCFVRLQAVAAIAYILLGRFGHVSAGVVK